MIRIVPPMRRQIKGDTKALLPRREGLSVKGIAFFHRTEPGVLEGEVSMGSVHGVRCRLGYMNPTRRSEKVQWDEGPLGKKG